MSIHAILFGGYQATQPQVDLWKTSAQQQRNDVTFDACPYPNTKDASRAGAVAAFGDKLFDAMKWRIEDVGADTLFIVGHSSGCAIADELNSRIAGDHSNITLVDLDGFGPLPGQVKGSSVQAWSAEGAGGKGKSYNWSSGAKKFISSSATQVWSLHFSLVNTAATDKITKETYPQIGYAGCVANLCWLPKKP